ncbi:hypothetical protein T08_9611 [Trichinella sp. T8]|nr:hypothetical protein T08_9611 [Trichinella sp. T8]
MWKYRRLVVGGRPFVRPAWSAAAAAAVVVVVVVVVVVAAAAAASAAVCTKCLTCRRLFGDSLGERFFFFCFFSVVILYPFQISRSQLCNRSCSTDAYWCRAVDMGRAGLLLARNSQHERRNFISLPTNFNTTGFSSGQSDFFRLLLLIARAQFFPMEALYAILESVHIYIPALVAIVCIVVIFYFGVASSSSTSQPPQEYLQEMRSGRGEKTKVKLPSKSTGNKLNKTSKTAKQSSTSKASSTNNNPKAKSGHVPTGAVGGQARSKGSRAREVREERANSDDVEMNEDLTNGWVTVTPRRGKQQNEIDSAKKNRKNQKKKDKRNNNKAGDEDEMGNSDRIGQSHSAKRPAAKQQKYGKVVNSNAAAELSVHSEEEIPSVKPEKKNSKKSNKAKRPGKFFCFLLFRSSRRRWQLMSRQMPLWNRRFQIQNSKFPIRRNVVSPDGSSDPFPLAFDCLCSAEPRFQFASKKKYSTPFYWSSAFRYKKLFKLWSLHSTDIHHKILLFHDTILTLDVDHVDEQGVP